MALSRHGDLYAMDRENLQGLDANGRLRWRVTLPRSPVSPLMVGQGGLLYYASGDRLHALAPDGRHQWTHEVGTVIAGPVESAGGLILVASPQRLLALRPGGEVEWSRTVGEPMPTRPLAASADGRIYLRTRTALLVLNERGEITSEEPVALVPTNLAVGNGTVQEGFSRRDAEGRELFTVASGLRYRTMNTMVDRHGHVLVMNTARGWCAPPSPR